MPELSYREAVRDALSQAMRKDEDVFVMGEDIAEMGGSMGVTAGMLDEFGPERVRNTPISEMAVVGAEIAAVVQEKAFDWLDAPIERVGAKFAPLPFAPVMEDYVVPHADDVLEAIKRTVARG